MTTFEVNGICLICSPDTLIAVLFGALFLVLVRARQRSHRARIDQERHKNEYYNDLESRLEGRISHE